MYMYDFWNACSRSTINHMMQRVMYGMNLAERRNGTVKRVGRRKKPMKGGESRWKEEKTDEGGESQRRWIARQRMGEPWEGQQDREEKENKYKWMKNYRKFNWIYFLNILTYHHHTMWIVISSFGIVFCRLLRKLTTWHLT